MRISAKCNYTCKALLELSLHWPNKEPLPIHVVSENQGIPIKYLAQILIGLKNIGLAASSRGKEGGYVLVRPPSEITLGEVMRHIGGSFLAMTDSAKKDSVFTTIWEELEDVMAKVLDKITFEDIADKAKGRKSVIVYQI